MRNNRTRIAAIVLAVIPVVGCASNSDSIEYRYFSDDRKEGLFIVSPEHVDETTAEKIRSEGRFVKTASSCYWELHKQIGWKTVKNGLTDYDLPIDRTTRLITPCSDEPGAHQ